ncbi:branched-chain amino acid transport system ATP-binding protein [Prauserella sediminis]|uniref:Branched-chain amino acid transport system ATP-binding protein n=1 Tax=Prauserella sediminis TaxID=577680 RepID=A0A839XR56_9PSEU|nr:ABC transporter ATP-binding protein [Prauserella sediminis]MBB3665187.1 branched-chain amino acid transport system ATP-binding protein [Prauserella sediminis]
MLDVSELHVSYGPVHAVRGVSFAVEPQRITLVLGANGAGKSTSLRAICGLQPARGGSVRLDGAELLGKRPHRIVRDGVSLVPEGRRIFAPLSVAENLRIGGYTATRSQVAALVDEVYDRFPILAQRRDMPAGLLSGGEQQMLAFGRALMGQPRVMLLDEPSMGLAPGMVDTVLTSVRAIADSGIGVLMVEQNVDAGLAVADTVSIVARGEVVRSGEAEQLRQDAAVVHALLGEAALAEEGTA